ncbi:MAG TPA: ABC transporter permease [Terriglobales bacterium]|jgi:predicted permease
MSAWRQLSLGSRALLRRGKSARDTDDEVAAYFAEARASGAGGGADPERVKDRMRAYGWENLVSASLADLRYGARQLRRNPAFTLTAVLVLGLGMGVATTLFSVMHAVLLRPLPYAHPEQLVTIAEPRGDAPGFWSSSHPDVLDWRSGNHSLAALAFYGLNAATLRNDSTTLLVGDYPASANLFSTLGVRLAAGRTFTPGEMASHAAVAVISHHLEQKWFAGQPALGKTLQLDGKPVTVIGVLPAAMRFPYDQPADVWTPYVTSAPDDRGQSGLLVIARLRPGVSLAAARSEISALQAALAQRYGNLHLPDRVEMHRYVDQMQGAARPALGGLGVAVGLIWLIACASVAGLLLTRMAGRRRELGVRTALGAGRGRILRQLLSESLLLGLLAGGAGWLTAALLLGALRPWILSHVAAFGVPAAAVAINPATLGVLLAATLLSVILIGLAPAWMGVRTPVTAGLGDRSSGVSRGQARLRNALVIAEIALALLLLAGAGLLLRTLYALQQVPLGFSGTNVVTTRLHVQPHRYQSQSIYQTFEAPLLERLRALPGVQAAAITSTVPLAQGVSLKGKFGIVGRPNLKAEDQPEGDMRYTSPDYPRVFGIPMERGRFFDAALDTPTSQAVAVINQAMAARYFPGQNPVGQEITLGKKQTATIIGVISDVRETAVGLPPGPEIHFSTTQLAPHGSAPFYNIGSHFVRVAVRGSGNPAALIPEIRAALHTVAPEVAPDEFDTMRQVVADSLGDQTFAARLLGIFALSALAIALAGLYGLLAYTVAQRRKEFGIRMALGAGRAEVAGLVFRQAAWLVGWGAAIGLALALGLTRLLAAWLYGVPARDPYTLAAVSLLLAACGLLASWFPARAAARVEPVIALRSE